MKPKWKWALLIHMIRSIPIEYWAIQVVLNQPILHTDPFLLTGRDVKYDKSHETDERSWCLVLQVL